MPSQGRTLYLARRATLQFARDGAILPALIETLLDEARSEAIAAKNAALSRALKIVMNSFYGVLGAPGCRFFDPRLPTSITRRGHAIIERREGVLRGASGLAVLYGDTDSLFVHVLACPPSPNRQRGSSVRFSRSS